MAYDILIENILKGIVVSHAKDGIQFHQIKNEFMRHAGDLFRTNVVKSLKGYLRSIDGLYHRYDEKGGPLKWYAGKASPTERNADAKQPDHEMHRRSSKVVPMRSKGNVRLPVPIYRNNNNDCSSSTRNTSNGKPSGSASNNTSFRSAARSDSTRMSARNRDGNWHKSTHYHRGKTAAALYDYELVGDDFLMSVATIDLNCAYTTKARLRCCGLCVSGQTIRSAAKRLSGYADMKIILNVGSVDLLHGRDFLDMREDFMYLMRVCEERNIQVIITTVAPLANTLNSSDTCSKYHAFNQFLVQTYSHSHKVLQIHECLLDVRSGKVLFDCYQPEPKYMTGSNRPHILWNRIGRQLVLKYIKSRIGI